MNAGIFQRLPRAIATSCAPFKPGFSLLPARKTPLSCFGTITTKSTPRPVWSCQRLASTVSGSPFNNGGRTSRLSEKKGPGSQGGSGPSGRRSLTSVILSTLAGSSAVASAAVWMAPEKTAPGSPPDILLNSEPLIDVAALETLPPPPEGWFRAHLRPELMTMGGALGAFTGFFTKKVGKMVAFIIGGGFVLLQFLAHAGFITISWSNVQKSFNRKLNTDANGQVPPSTVVVIFKRLLRWLTADIPFTGGFIAGFWIGFRFG